MRIGETHRHRIATRRGKHTSISKYSEEMARLAIAHDALDAQEGDVLSEERLALVHPDLEIFAAYLHPAHCRK